MSDIVLTIAGVSYSGWASLDLTITMESLAGSFNLSLTDKINPSNKPVKLSPTIKPGVTCSVKLNDQLVITGYIDKVTIIYDANTHTIVIQGRDKTGDLVDCSMTQEINQWKGLTIDQIVTRICQPFNIPVSINVSAGDPFNSFVVDQGATCFEIIQKLCYMRQLLAISDGKGGLLLTTAGTDKATTAIVQGQNIKSAQADYDYSQRYSIYLCKGQQQGSDLSSPINNTGNFGEYDDPVIKRYRPLMIIADGQASTADCTQRAKWQGAIARGKSRKLNVTVNGWSQQDGNLWGINKLVSINSSLLGVQDDLLISSCNFKLDENGEISVLTLTDAEAYTLISESLIKSAGLLKSNQYLSG